MGEKLTSPPYVWSGANEGETTPKNIIRFCLVCVVLVKSGHRASLKCSECDLVGGP